MYLVYTCMYVLYVCIYIYICIYVCLNISYILSCIDGVFPNEQTVHATDINAPPYHQRARLHTDNLLGGLSYFIVQRMWHS